MNNDFSSKHPWLTKKFFTRLWKINNYIGDFYYTVKLDYSGKRIRINSKDESVGKLIFLGQYELETKLFTAKYLVPGDKVIDIGANIGYFSLLFSNYVGEKGEVHAFEPSRREFFELCSNVKINNLKNIYLNQLAVSNQSGNSLLNVFDDRRFGAYNSLNKSSHPFVKGAKTNNERIRTVKLDDYLSLFRELNPCLIKIDVEGFEKQALEGMESLLLSEEAPCLVLEVCETTHTEKQNSPENIMHYLKSFAYELYAPNKEGNLIFFEIGKSLNCIALKPSHSKRLQEQGIKKL